MKAKRKLSISFMVYLIIVGHYMADTTLGKLSKLNDSTVKWWTSTAESGISATIHGSSKSALRTV